MWEKVHAGVKRRKAAWQTEAGDSVSEICCICQQRRDLERQEKRTCETCWEQEL